MKFHIVTIFPEAFDSYFSSSILGRALEKKLFGVEFYKLNDFSTKRFGHVDDNAYGMHGQVISPEPLAKALDSILEQTGTDTPVVYLTPGGELLQQKKIESCVENWKNSDVIFICGHYEGIDQRIRDIYVTHEFSIGEYVLSSGELSAMVFIDSLVRHIPEVLGNPESLIEESFSEKLERKKEYPVYTRPKIFRGKEVPEILTSGNHAKIEKWKYNNLT
ncbi:MAG: tRNA (guanosine(37)-N1)-methyltransferase TrmD [Candidatus Gracilibacteria bacterium]|nr:tRNA (guanosine(37)-N1)-methyltransferase TrmD [Candidatus Gracilibacteria bacterium]